MQKPESCPDDVWENATREERRCFVEGHNWYYDTCERCGARKEKPANYRTRKPVANLAGGR
jgi:hypothetical protein